MTSANVAEPLDVATLAAGAAAFRVADQAG
jgi:hypothetical protein